MTETRMSVQEFVGKFVCGEFDSTDTETQIKAGWYDWFCDSKSLARRTQTLGKLLVAIAKSKKFDPKNTYVFFKNNCPVNGGLYDSFSICSLDQGRAVLFWVSPKCTHSGKAEVYDMQSETSETPVVLGTVQDIKNYFLS